MHNATRDLHVEHINLFTKIHTNKDVVAKPRGLTSSSSRPADIMPRNFYGVGKHVIVDVGITSALTNTAISRKYSSKKPGVSVAYYAQAKI